MLASKSVLHFDLDPYIDPIRRIGYNILYYLSGSRSKIIPGSVFDPILEKNELQGRGGQHPNLLGR